MTLSLISLALLAISLSTNLSVKASDYAIVDPETNEPLPEENSIGLDSAGGIDSPHFNCNGGRCQSCVGVRYHSHHGDLCIGAGFIREKVAAEVDFSINGRRVWSDEVSPSNPPSICEDISGPVRGCLKVHDIHTEGENIHVCFKVSMKVFRMTVAKSELGCVTVGRNGAHYSRS